MDQRLEVFLKVIEKKNFSKAAEELHMTQPAVSQYIRSLEDSTGVKLLERTNKYVRLNKAGEIVYHHAIEIKELYAKMNHLLDDLTNKASGSIAIGASYTFGEYLLPRIIAEAKQQYPDIKPTVTIGNTTTIAGLVLSHQLDVGIVEGHFKGVQELKTEPFAEDRMVIVASADHPLAGREEPITMKELIEETWILRELGSGTREASENVFKQFSIAPQSIMHFSSTQPIKAMVEAGMGISLLSEWAVQKELRYGDIKVLDVKELPYTRNFSIVTRSPFQTKALSAFLELLKSHKELTDFKIQ
ncbi:DNA-binding transcriptional LysR family regulator [Planomicrobium stackebrandtii]|uniref:DNA-binding transcriptional LysR family regulator n=1 Tax=Planomicrobium stackebrandtii TaxID=253160 RepID=A0ABU0GXQ6_9BACL|nr:LysR family transcriptional regulator [Planomicrobium stackebrandtii]MDQ0430156.1 DNA-binding transcriptional LysR family regulator [Planomicrobium stackebrandtii]